MYVKKILLQSLVIAIKLWGEWPKEFGHCRNKLNELYKDYIVRAIY